jgi:outer membrane protein assembly factor BamB
VRRLALLLLVLLPLVACPPQSQIPVPPGCARDVDCKGARICVASRCIDPPRDMSTAVDLGGLSTTVAGLEPLVDAGPAALDVDGGVTQVALDTLGPSPTFHANSAHTGRSRFRAPASAPHDQPFKTGGVVFGAAAVGDDVVVFGSHDRSVYAVNLDGTLRWKLATGDLVWAAPTIGPGGVVYAGSDDDKLYAIDLKDGGVRWTFTAGPCRRAVGPGPEAARCDVDGINLGSDGTIYFVADGVYAVKPDGTLRWKFSPGNVHCASPPAIGPDGTVYAGCQDDAIYALDGATGVKRWEFRTGGDVDGTPALGADGTIYVGADDKALHILKK